MDMGFEPYKMEENYLGWQIIRKLWTKIYKEYFVTSEYKQSMNIDFELYDEKDTEIWIPICK